METTGESAAVALVYTTCNPFLLTSFSLHAFTESNPNTFSKTFVNAETFAGSLIKDSDWNKVSQFHMLYPYIMSFIFIYSMHYDKTVIFRWGRPVHITLHRYNMHINTKTSFDWIMKSKFFSLFLYIRICLWYPYTHDYKILYLSWWKQLISKNFTYCI